MDNRYYVVNQNGNVVRSNITKRQAVAFCLRYPRRGYDIACKFSDGMCLVTWVFDLSKY